MNTLDHPEKKVVNSSASEPQWSPSLRTRWEAAAHCSRSSWFWLYCWRPVEPQWASWTWPASLAPWSIARPRFQVAAGFASNCTASSPRGFRICQPRWTGLGGSQSSPDTLRPFRHFPWLSRPFSACDAAKKGNPEKNKSSQHHASIRKQIFDLGAKLHFSFNCPEKWPDVVYYYILARIPILLLFC